ncbi:unnamed protein product [Chironomus riparius]|uniref:Uncharacterized protein n=1 Tax=Chironomus riparius TaxID=315576 RepID=A0A9N9RN72_9DIPT|nr:unnamed protein product [Chironomus riparius]
MNAFICLFVIAVSAQAIMAETTATPTISQMKVDEGLFCRDLCKYDLSGPACDIDCTGIETEVLDVSTDFCNVLCKHGLGYNRCKCPEVETYHKNENVVVCFAFYIYNNVSLKGCPKCPFIGMSHHKPGTHTEGTHSHTDAHAHSGGGRPTGNPYAHLIVTPEDKKLAAEVKEMYCGYTCKNHPERGGGYCKCVKA